MWGFARLASDLHTLIQSHSDLLRFALPFQIHSVSLRFIQSHSDSSFMQIRSASCRLTQIFMQFHPDSLRIILSCSVPVGFTHFRPASSKYFQLHSHPPKYKQAHILYASTGLIQTHRSMFRVAPNHLNCPIHSDQHSSAQIR